MRPPRRTRPVRGAAAEVAGAEGAQPSAGPPSVAARALSGMQASRRAVRPAGAGAPPRRDAAPAPEKAGTTARRPQVVAPTEPGGASAQRPWRAAPAAESGSARRSRHRRTPPGIARSKRVAAGAARERPARSEPFVRRARPTRIRAKRAAGARGARARREAGRAGARHAAPGLSSRGDGRAGTSAAEPGRGSRAAELAPARAILGSITTSVGPPIITRCSVLSRRISTRRRR